MTTLYPPRKAVKTVSVAAVRWSLAVVFAISMATSFVVSTQGQDRDAKIARNTHNMCLATNRAARSVNTVLDTLKAGANDPGLYTPKERAVRVARYKAAEVPMIPCGQLALKP